MALTRITKGVIKPNENYDTHNIVSTGIVTSVGLDVNGNADISGSLSVGGVLTYEDVTSVDSIGIITARTGLVSPYADIDDFVSVGSNIHLGNAGVVTATSFVGDGSNLTNTGSTLSEPSSGTQRLVTTSLTTGTMTSSGTGSELAFDYANNHLEFSDGTRATFGTDNDLQLYHSGSNAFLTNSTGFFRVAATTTGGGLYLDGSSVFIRSEAGDENLARFINDGAVELYHNNVKRLETSSVGVSIPQDLDVDGHTNLDNVSVAGVSTFAGTLNASTVSSTAFIASGDLDVDGHTFLDNVSIAGVTTVSGILDATNTPASIRVAQDIQHKGDADTKITFPAADTVSIETAGSERVRITSGGNIGIGTDNPATKTAIVGSDSGDVYLQIANSTTGSDANSGFLVGLKSDEGATLYQMENNYMRFGTNGAERLRITSAGRILIATTSEGHGNADDLTIGTAGGSLGNTGITIRSSTTGDGNIFFSDATSGDGETKGVIKYAHNTDHMQFNTAGSERLRITSGGEVLIGTTTDANVKLDVEGSLRAKSAGYVAPASGTGLEIYYATNTLNDAPSGYLISYDRSSSAYKKINYDASEHKFRTSGTEKVRIDSTGRVLIGTTTEGYASADDLTVATTGSTGITIRSGTGSLGTIAYSDGTSGDAEYRGYFQYDHNGDFLKIGTAGAEKVRIDSAGQVLPGADDAQNLGSSTKRWANIYAADMHYSNEGGENSVDGTWGSYTIQEGESDLYLLNNRNGKKYKFVLQEVS